MKTRNILPTCTFCKSSACFSDAGCPKKKRAHKLNWNSKNITRCCLCVFSQSKKWLKVCSREDTFRILVSRACTTIMDSPEQTACDAQVLQLVVVVYSKTLYIRNNATCWTANIANTFKYAWVQAQRVPMNNLSKHASTAYENLLAIKRFLFIRHNQLRITGHMACQRRMAWMKLSLTTTRKLNKNTWHAFNLHFLCRFCVLFWRRVSKKNAWRKLKFQKYYSVLTFCFFAI